MKNLDIARRLQGVRDASAANQAIKRLGLIRYADGRTLTLPLATLQRLAIDRAVLHAPELALDEPHNGLDAQGSSKVHQLLSGLRPRPTDDAVHVEHTSL